MKTLTDFRKTMETGVDPRLALGLRNRALTSQAENVRLIYVHKLSLPRTSLRFELLIHLYYLCFNTRLVKTSLLNVKSRKSRFKPLFKT